MFNLLKVWFFLGLVGLCFVFYLLKDWQDILVMTPYSFLSDSTKIEFLRPGMGVACMNIFGMSLGVFLTGYAFYMLLRKKSRGKMALMVREERVGWEFLLDHEIKRIERDLQIH